MKNYSIPQKYEIKKTTENMSLYSSYKHNNKGMVNSTHFTQKKTEKEKRQRFMRSSRKF